MFVYSDRVAFHGMRESMGWQGEGWRFTLISRPAMFNPAIWAGLLAIALGACADSSAGGASTAATTPAVTAPSAPGARPAAPERVVQRLSPGAEAKPEVERLENTASTGKSASAVTARGSEPSDTTITPRHLEAELNRLEAELAN